MKMKEAGDKLKPIAEQAEKDGDCYLFAYFSRADDAYDCNDNMDSGDALLIIEGLMKAHGITAEGLGFIKTDAEKFNLAGVNK